MEKKALKMKTVRFGFDAQFCGHMEETVKVPEHWDDERLKQMFYEIFGIPFDDNCYYEILG